MKDDSAATNITPSHDMCPLYLGKINHRVNDH